MNRILSHVTRTKAVTILVIVGLVEFWSGLSNKFAYDDSYQIVASPFIRDIGYIFSAFGNSIVYPGTSMMPVLHIYYRPLVQVIYTIIYALAAATPGPYHLVQLMFHIGSSIVLYMLLARFTRYPWVALFCALVFMVHPINSEVVVYIGDMQDAMYQFFGLTAFYIVVSRGTDSYTRRDILVIAALLLASLLSKEEGILYVAAIGVYVYMFASLRLSSVVKALCIAAVVYIPLRIWGSLNSVGSVVPSVIQRLPVATKLVSIPGIVGYYMLKTIAPVNLAIGQEWYVKNLTPRDFYIPIVFVLVCAWLMVDGARYVRGESSKSHRLYVFWGMWYVVGVLMHAQILPMDLTVADRWYYYPMIGLMGMLALVIDVYWSKIAKNKLLLRLTIIVGVCVLIALSVFTRERIYQWRDPLELYAHDLRYAVSSPALENLYAEELMRHGNIESARTHLVRSIQQDPLLGTNTDDLARIEEATGRYKQAEVLYKREIALPNGLPKYAPYGGLARIALHHERNPKKVVALSREGLKNSPYDELLSIYLVIGLYQDNQCEEALVTAARLNESKHDALTQQLYQLVRDHKLTDESIKDL